MKACFVAGTPIRTLEGSKAVELFRAGDLVLSRDELDPNGAVAFKRVLRTFVRVSPILNLRVGGRTIGTTAEHPFFVRGKGWVDARMLRLGDELQPSDGRWLTCEGVAYSGRVESVYNMEVEDYHTYFVGDASWGWDVWAHNANKLVYGAYGDQAKTKRPGLQNHHLNQHGAYGHAPTSTGNTGRPIPYRKGTSTPMQGGTATKGSEHNKVHKELEEFWDQYRKGGAKER